MNYSAHVDAKVEISLEKLQIVATTAVEPKYKLRWLQWWNSSKNVRKDLKFPKYPTGKDTLKKWVDRTALWTKIDESATQELVRYICEPLEWSTTPRDHF